MTVPSPAPSIDPTPAAGRPRVLLTGATSGIGRRLATLLAVDHELVVSGREPATVSSLAGELGADGLVLDLADPAGIAAGCTRLGDVDAVVHCAGIESGVTCAELTPEHLAEVLAVNLGGPVELTRVLLPGLQRRRGHVVLVSSTAALDTFGGWAAYSASKAALRSYANTLRLEQRPYGVRVTSVFPGRTDTDMQRRMAARNGTEFDPATAMSPESVASALHYVLTAPRDVEIGELRLTPAPRP